MTRRPGRARVRPVEFSEADRELAETLDSLDGAANYAQWIYDLLEPHLGRLAWRSLQRRPHHGFLRRRLQLRARRIHRYATGCSLLHWNAGMVRLV